MNSLVSFDFAIRATPSTIRKLVPATPTIGNIPHSSSAIIPSFNQGMPVNRYDLINSNKKKADGAMRTKYLCCQ